MNKSVFLLVAAGLLGVQGCSSGGKTPEGSSGSSSSSGSVVSSSSSSSSSSSGSSSSSSSGGTDVASVERAKLFVERLSQILGSANEDNINGMSDLSSIYSGNTSIQFDRFGQMVESAELFGGEQSEYLEEAGAVAVAAVGEVFEDALTGIVDASAPELIDGLVMAGEDKDIGVNYSRQSTTSGFDSEDIFSFGVDQAINVCPADSETENCVVQVRLAISATIGEFSAGRVISNPTDSIKLSGSYLSPVMISGTISNNAITLDIKDTSTISFDEDFSITYSPTTVRETKRSVILVSLGSMTAGLNIEIKQRSATTPVSLSASITGSLDKFNLQFLNEITESSDTLVTTTHDEMVIQDIVNFNVQLHTAASAAMESIGANIAATVDGDGQPYRYVFDNVNTCEIDSDGLRRCSDVEPVISYEPNPQDETEQRFLPLQLNADVVAVLNGVDDTATATLSAKRVTDASNNVGIVLSSPEENWTIDLITDSSEQLLTLDAQGDGIRLNMTRSVDGVASGNVRVGQEEVGTVMEMLNQIFLGFDDERVYLY